MTNSSETSNHKKPVSTFVFISIFAFIVKFSGICKKNRKNNLYYSLTRRLLVHVIKIMQDIYIPCQDFFLIIIKSKNNVPDIAQNEFHFSFNSFVLHSFQNNIGEIITFTYFCILRKFNISIEVMAGYPLFIS